MGQMDAADRGDLDKRYMRRALRLALKGAGRTSPNPMVGAVLVRDGKVVAKGYHRRAGGGHAEIVALKQAGAKARGATLYLNLEPCDHQGRTPPCTASLIRSGIRRVVIGMVDPNPLVSGRGIRRLRRAGIRVDVGLLEEECRSLNEAFIKYITRHIPFVILKLAASLDGKIATSSGDSKWITQAAARSYVHRLRNEVDAVIVGIGTVLADNPQLTCRLADGRNPWRVVFDSHLRIPLTSRLFHQRDPQKTILVASSHAPLKKIKAVESFGAQVWTFPLRRGTIPWASLLRESGKMGWLSVMVEGGGTTASRALAEGVVDKILFFFAPKVIGGEGRNMIQTLGIRKMGQSKKIKNMEVSRIGKDFLVSGYL
jgi:diaminohydroxyphosphoribosylaminopyrimidine deaminase / 5-amino-6-(5-phosphoribosylamino)uracil reductase